MDKFKTFIESRSPEARLRRVEKHSQTRNIGIISAQRTGQSADEFHAQHRQLAHDIRTHGLGYIRVRGASVENSGTPQETQVKGEHSYLVIGKKGSDSGQMKGFLRKHGEKYGQSSVLYKQHNKPNAVWIGTSKDSHDPDYGKEKDIGTFHPKRIGQYFSTIVKGKKPFTYHEQVEFYEVSTAYHRRQETAISLDEVVKIIMGEPTCEADEILAESN